MQAETRALFWFLVMTNRPGHAKAPIGGPSGSASARATPALWAISRPNVKVVQITFGTMTWSAARDAGLVMPGRLTLNVTYACSLIAGTATRT
jgi:hypothetical protein